MTPPMPVDERDLRDHALEVQRVLNQMVDEVELLRDDTTKTLAGAADEIQRLRGVADFWCDAYYSTMRSRGAAP